MCAEDLVAKVNIAGLGLTVSQYLVYDPDRHGKPRYYFRRKGQKKIRLRAPPGTPEFLAEFQAAYAGPEPAMPSSAPAATEVRRGAPKGSLAWLFNEYEARAESFKVLGPTTKARRRVVMDQICAEPVSTTDPAPIGLRPFASLRPKVIEVICGRCPTPATFNARLKAYRESLKFAIGQDLMTANPAKEVPYRVSKTDGYHTWSVEEVAQYEAKWPLGSIQRLALAMLMFTGTRRSDAVVIGKQHRKAVQGIPGWQFTQFKGRNRSPVTTWIPILPALQEVIDATPVKPRPESVVRHHAYLETSFGKPFTAKGFGTQFKKWCRLAALSHCSAHGLRKAAATIAAERGATAHQLMAIFGWRSITQALVYTRAAEQKRMAAAAMHMLAPTPAPKEDKNDDIKAKISG
jgi:integrase